MALKTLEVVLSNSISMKAEVAFMHTIKHLEMTLANSVAGVTVFTGICLGLYASSAQPRRWGRLTCTVWIYVHEIDVCNLLLFFRSCTSDEESNITCQ